jgi:hypothetical protein
VAAVMSALALANTHISKIGLDHASWHQCAHPYVIFHLPNPHLPLPLDTSTLYLNLE